MSSMFWFLLVHFQFCILHLFAFTLSEATKELGKENSGRVEEPGERSAW